MNFVRAGVPFMKRCRELCTEYGALLIFDEVMTGFRVALGGAQSGCVQLTKLEHLASLDAFGAWLIQPKSWLGVFDLPFGLPRELVEYLQWPSSWPDLIKHYAALSREEIRAIEEKRSDRADNPLKHAPHTAASLLRGEWTHTYPREVGAAVLGEDRHAKYWPPVGRVDNVLGDRNLFCSCVPVGDYAANP
jgi:hypothetical protein